jgi:hypothetical protein
MHAGRERREDLRVRQRNSIARTWRGIEVEADPLSFL